MKNIDNQIHANIVSRLEKLEFAQGIKILLAVESGSRAWGFASQDSDYDVRFVYLRNPNWYLSVQKRRDVIELPINSDLDFSGWDVQKALCLIGKCNPSLTEWLKSPMIYKQSPEAEALRGLSKRYFQPRVAMYHYLHMAERNYREYLKGKEVRLKKYLYVLRPLLACEWLYEHHSAVPLSIYELIDNSKGAPKTEIQGLITQKINGFESSTGPRIEVLNGYIKERIAFFAEQVQTLPKMQLVYDELDEVFFRLVWQNMP